MRAEAVANPARVKAVAVRADGAPPRVRFAYTIMLVNRYT